MNVPSKDAMHFAAHKMDNMLNGCLLDEILYYLDDVREDDLLAHIADMYDLPYEELVADYNGERY